MKYMNCNLCLEYKILQRGIRHFADAIITLLFFHSSVPVFCLMKHLGTVESWE